MKKIDTTCDRSNGAGPPQLFKRPWHSIPRFSIQWGEEDFEKLSPEEQKERTTTYNFATEAELKAFWLGMMDGGGWNYAAMIDTKKNGEVLNAGSPEDLAASEYDHEAWAAMQKGFNDLD